MGHLPALRFGTAFAAVLAGQLRLEMEQPRLCKDAHDGSTRQSQAWTTGGEICHIMSQGRLGGKNAPGRPHSECKPGGRVFRDWDRYVRARQPAEGGIVDTADIRLAPIRRQDRRFRQGSQGREHRRFPGGRCVTHQQVRRCLAVLSSPQALPMSVTAPARCPRRLPPPARSCRRNCRPGTSSDRGRRQANVPCTFVLGAR